MCCAALGRVGPGPHSAYEFRMSSRGSARERRLTGGIRLLDDRAVRARDLKHYATLPNRPYVRGRTDDLEDFGSNQSGSQEPARQPVHRDQPCAQSPIRCLESKTRGNWNETPLPSREGGKEQVRLMPDETKNPPPGQGVPPSANDELHNEDFQFVLK